MRLLLKKARSRNFIPAGVRASPRFGSDKNACLKNQRKQILGKSGQLGSLGQALRNRVQCRASENGETTG
jgi:hypothetical protein